jgi:pentose-5-phosphate-3-epimerase
MVQSPLDWSQSLGERGVKRIYWHVEVLSPDTVIPHHISQIEYGVALRLETPVATVEPFIPMVKSVLLLSITEPGYQGEPFQESIYDKIKELKRKHPHVKIMVDGGVNLEHLKPLAKLGVDRVAVGNAFWKFGDPKTVLAAFRQATL